MEEFSPQRLGVTQDIILDLKLFKSIDGFFCDQHIDRSSTPRKFLPNINCFLENGHRLAPSPEIECPKHSHQARSNNNMLILLLSFVDHLILNHLIFILLIGFYDKNSRQNNLKKIIFMNRYGLMLLITDRWFHLQGPS